MGLRGLTRQRAHQEVDFLVDLFGSGHRVCDLPTQEGPKTRPQPMNLGAHGRLAQAEALQGAHLEQLAEQELVAQQERLAAYQVQARFALADIYDRASLPPPAASPDEARQ